MTTPRHPARRATVVAALLTGAACEDPFVFATTGPPSVATVTLTPDTARLRGSSS